MKAQWNSLLLHKLPTRQGVLTHIWTKSSKNINSEFDTCGYVPLNQDVVLNKLADNVVGEFSTIHHLWRFFDEMKKKRKKQKQFLVLSNKKK